MLKSLQIHNPKTVFVDPSLRRRSVAPSTDVLDKSNIIAAQF